jgi:hypothetical protein
VRVQSPGAEVSPEFSWSPDGLGVGAVFSREALEAMRAAAVRAAAEHHEEAGGILLGSAENEDGDTWITRVNGFEPFAIEHRYGPGFSLSLRDQKRLRHRVEKLEHARPGGRPVGFFRAHVRRGLYLDQRDFDLFGCEFRHPASVVLLVRPEEAGAATGGVFVWEGEDMRRHSSYLEFPIECAVPGEAAARMPAPVRAAAPVFAPAVEAPRPVVNELPGVNWRLPRLSVPMPALPRLRVHLKLPRAAFGWAGMRPAALLLLVLGLPLAAFYLGRGVGLRERHGDQPVELTARAPERRVVKRTRAQAPPVTQPPADVSEEAQRDRWAEPPSAAAPQPAPPEAVAPQPAAAPPAIKPIVPDEGGSAEDLRHPQANASPLRASGAAVRQPAAPPARNTRLTANRRMGPVTRSWKVAETKPLPAPRIPDPPEVASIASSQVPALPAAFSHGYSNSAHVVAYVRPLRSGFIHKVPVLRALSGRSEGFTAASPLDHPMPRAAALEPGAGETAVKLEAKVDRGGRVVQVRFVEGNQHYAQLSSETLRRWRFEPARQNGAAVESELQVLFQFSGAAQKKD